MRAQASDADHDRAWPSGPTSACNAGPLCRRHHRVKQLLMGKTRGQRSAVVWTGPTGRTWTSPGQHTPHATAVRPEPLIADAARTSRVTDRPERLTADGAHSPSPDALAELLAEPAEVDALGEQIHADDGWGLALDPYRWTA